MPETKVSDSAFFASQILSVELLSELLTSSSSGDLSIKLAEQLRELTGAKTVMLVGINSQDNILKQLHVCPSRRSDIFKLTELELIYRAKLLSTRPQKTSEIDVDNQLYKILQRNFIESIFRVILKIGNEVVGMLVLLDIPQVERFEDVKTIINILVTPISLLIKNIEAKDEIFSKNLQIQSHVEELESLVAERTVELAEANRKLAQEKERLVVILRSLGEAVLTTDLTGEIIEVNKSAERLLLLPAGQIKGRNIAEVYRRFNLADKSQVNPPHSLLEVSGETGKSEDLILKREKSEIIISETLTYLTNRKSQRIGVVIVFKDITERYRFFDTAIKAERLESLGIVAGGIAHDFNNLLAGIFGYIEMANQEESPDEIKTLLEGALQGMERARSLTSQLLTFSKGGQPHKQVFDVGNLVEETARFALSGSIHKFEIEKEENLRCCNVDKNQIAQVIDNILINAQQAMKEPGKILVRLENYQVSPESAGELKPGDYVKIDFLDQGAGISAENLKRIFDPFFTTKKGGSGIGLATSYSIVSRHGGTIEVQSKPGLGSTFTVFLPATDEKHPHKGSTVAENIRDGGHILVMDDEDMLLNLMERMLAKSGRKIIKATNGTDAIEIFSQDRQGSCEIAAAFLDLTIPGGMGGIEAVKKIREIDGSLPVVVMSGYHSSPALAEPENFGFNARLLKPFTFTELKEVLASLPEKFHKVV